MKTKALLKVIIPLGVILAVGLLVLVAAVRAEDGLASARGMPSGLHEAAPLASSLSKPASAGEFAAPLAGRLSQQTWSPYTCTLATTTTVDSIGQNSFDNAAPLAPYSALVLAPGNKDQEVRAYDQYFRLDNAVANALYKVEAIPNGTSNYNLGLAVYDSSRNLIKTDADTADYKASIEFKPTGLGPYYFKVSQISASCTGGTYRLSYTRQDPTPTRTDTPEPSQYLTDTLDCPSETDCPGNNTFADATAVSAGSIYNYLTFYWNWPTETDVDYYKIWAKEGRTYRAEVLVAAGLDSYLEVYTCGTPPSTSNCQSVTANDDYNGVGSRVEWASDADRWYYLKVTNNDPSDPTNKTYTLEIKDITASAPTPTATPTFTDTLECQPFTEKNWDCNNGNNSFDSASLLSAGSTYNSLTFYWDYPTPDVDYYKIWAKAGRSYRVETLVEAGLDSYIEVYSTTYQLLKANDDYSGLGSRVEWTSLADSWYYVKVTNHDDRTGDPRGKKYTLEVKDTTPAQPTPTSTPTATGAACTPDGFEPNDDSANATLTSVGSQYSNLTLQGNAVDWFKMWGKNDWGRYRVETKGGLDTVLEIYGPNDSTKKIAGNDDKAYNDFGSLVVWTAPKDGWYFIKIYLSQGARAQGVCGNYTLDIVPLDVTPTPKPTAEPGPTAVTGADRFEPNHDFDRATTIALDVMYDNLNFVPYAPWEGHWEDNDYYKLHVKPGMLVTCETLKLSSGTDTNMIIYNNERQGIAGNDDVDMSAGKFESRVSYFATYTGWLYILVGQGREVPLVEAKNYTYSLRCQQGTQATRTPTLTPEPPIPTLVPPPTGLPTPVTIDTPQPTNTAEPVIPPLTPTASPTPLPPIQVRALATSVPPGLPRQVVIVELRVFYDLNENEQPDFGEGIIGLQVQAYDLVDGSLLAQGFTDETGQVVLSVTALGSVRVVVSYLGFEATVPPGGGALQVRISPRQLPSMIP